MLSFAKGDKTTPLKLSSKSDFFSDKKSSSSPVSQKAPRNPNKNLFQA